MWMQLMKTPTTWLPWGTDVLRLGGKEPERIWDLTRVGRQPPEWDDDLVTEQACLKRNLRFHGRPIEFVDSASRNQETLMKLYRQTKFMLAFSNTANPTNYTHPSREYITARWVDALACGAVVAGIPPKEPSIDSLLWSGATLDTGTIQREDGLRVITQAVHTWRTEQAERNYRQALERLDWRWRFATIADFFKESPQRLNDELQLLHQKIEQEHI
ncbi:MAG: glycosyltransferase family 1 protein [Chroococcidiopsidaceae cyanobacterium CP_BM_ER_R8_30]|nr:glycosyltransferase family 1 protein [Chroococcidiopsidaceae cyanobacterium CP_BM_ER_R8_30]